MKTDWKSILTWQRVAGALCVVGALELSRLSQTQHGDTTQTLLRLLVFSLSLTAGYYDTKNPLWQSPETKSFKLQPARVVWGDRKANWLSALLFCSAVVVNNFYLEQVGYYSVGIWYTAGAIGLAGLAGKLWYHVSPHSFWGLSPKKV